MSAVLFLDDDMTRCSNFRSRCPSADIVHDSESCIAKLQDGDYDEVHLDHDLGGEIYCDSNREDTGMEVVRWMCLNKCNARTVIVHSYNPHGANEMMIALEAAGYRVLRIPFEYQR